ncbi:MAG: VOC family protein [Bacteroidota bacterium]|nr:hypothetical protein [Chitinophagaceae bacterium]QLH46446.1 MAG: VOC family protein [Bacteroidota bacterium]
MQVIQWIEIPAQNLERAYQFYFSVLSGHVRKGSFQNQDVVLFDVPFQNGEAVGGSITVREDLKPGTTGALIYLNPFSTLSEAVHKVQAAGGQVLADQIPLGKFGYAAICMDTEGNKIGLLSHEA